MNNVVYDIDYTKSGLDDTEEGYTKLTNIVLDALMMANITMHQQKVMLAIIRKTYGFNKSVDRITNSQIANMTGIPITRVCTAKNKLLERHFLFMDGNGIGVNNLVSSWHIFPEKGNTQNGETFPETGNKTFPKSGNPYSPKWGHTKDTITKEKKNNNVLLKHTPPIVSPPFEKIQNV